MMSTTRSPDERWIQQHAEVWVEQGLVTAEQAAAIERFEADRPAVAVSEAGGPGLSLVSEAAAYVGSVLALLAGAFVMARSWEQLPVVVRVLAGVLVAAVGLVGGWSVMRVGDAGSLRLGGFLRAVGAAGAAFAVGVVAFEADAPDWTAAMAIGVTLVAIGWPLWRNLDRPMQLLTTAAGVVSMAVAVDLIVEPAPWVAGAVAWVVGVALLAAGSTERLRPPVYVACLGAVAMLLGSSGALDLAERAGIFAIVATAVVVVVVGVWQRCVPVLVIGVLGLLQSTVQMLAMFARGPGVLLAILLAGVATVVVVLTRVRRAPPSVPT